MSDRLVPVTSASPHLRNELAPVDQRQLIQAHRAMGGLEQALRFAPNSVAVSFRDTVWLLDGLGAVQLDGQPVWLQTLIEEPPAPTVLLTEAYASIASSIAHPTQQASVTRSMALHITERLNSDASSTLVTLRRDANSNETLQHGLAHWEHFVSDEVGDMDSLVLAAIADAKFRRLSPFTANNHATASLLLSAVLRDEQMLRHAPLCLSNYFSRHSVDFYQALADDEAIVRFFLRAISDSANELLDSLQLLVNHIEYCREVIDDTLSRAPIDVVLQAVCRPICTNADLMESGITRRQTSSSYLKKLADAGLLQPHPKGKELRYVNTGVLEAFSSLR